MTEPEALHPRRRLAAIAFTLLVALSIASTLAWNMNFRGDQPSARDKATAASTRAPEAQPDSRSPKATKAAR